MYGGSDAGIFQIIFGLFEFALNTGQIIALLLGIVALWRVMKAQQSMAASMEKIEQILTQSQNQ